MQPTIRFSFVTAFSDDPFGGNPAAVIFVDPSLSENILVGLAKNLNQPVLAAVSTASHLSNDGEFKTDTRSVRYFVANGKELPFCGHATLAAAKVIFQLDATASNGITSIHFETKTGITLTATKLDDGFIEIVFPAGIPGDVQDGEKERLKVLVNAAFGREVRVVDIKTGGGSYTSYVIIEIDERDDLEGSSVNAKALLKTGFVVNIIASSSPNPEEVFVSRMFSPIMLEEGEDHVCGSAHAVQAPYWYSRKGIKSGTEVKARQVSARGGKLKVVWDQAEGIVKLRGRCTVFASGNLDNLPEGSVSEAL